MLRAVLATTLLLAVGASAEAGSRSLDDPSVTVGSWSRGQVPLCDAQSVLNNIANRYHKANVETWQTGLSIGTVTKIDQVKFEPANPGLIDRRFCHARVELSNGAPADMFYLIEERQGVASIGWGVEFCLPNQDPWRVYDSSCRSIRYQ
ncbi:hypothetical protein LB518_02630 [Mesorhizobium sp. BR1-1-16]|uniref:hypothetical protein n=1 Tax=Mesorhizobium sp. BR1-1-16 TaxID=2876653 RepID=UPI001CCC61D1|nr:hypothetical protein [Mesorhizobium sp. BR1-1-16]MBZ9935176.1 hypothetical protein [Mesorhizobium sp. BR1-1-16]